MLHRNRLYLLIRYISPCIVFLADWALISLDKQEHLIDVKYVICTNFTHTPEDRFMAETSWGISGSLLAESLHICTHIF